MLYCGARLMEYWHAQYSFVKSRESCEKYVTAKTYIESYLNVIEGTTLNQNTKA